MTTAVSLSVQGLGAVTAIVVARFLGPEEYGLAALVMTISVLANLLCELGLGPALLARRIDSDQELRAAHTLMWGVSALLIAGLLAASVPVALFYDEPLLRTYVPLSALGVLVGTTRAIPTYRLLVQDNIHAFSLIAVVSQVFGSVAGVILAVAGFGAYAVILQPFFVNGLHTILAYRAAGMVPRFGPVAPLRPLFPEIRSVSLNQATEYLYLQTDKVLVGRMYSAADLGRYGLAFAVLMRPVVLFAHSITAVAIRQFADVADDLPRFSEGAGRALGYIGRLSIPALAGSALVAEDLVAVLLGPKWADSVTLIRIFFWGGISHVLSAAFAPLWLALGWQALVRWWGIYVHLGLSAAIVLAGLYWSDSVEDVALAYVGLSAAVLLPLRVWHSARNGLHLGRAIPFWLATARDATGMALVVLAIQHVAVAWTPLARLSASVASGALVYLVLAWLLSRSQMQEMLDLARKVVRRQ